MQIGSATGAMPTMPSAQPASQQAAVQAAAKSVAATSSAAKDGDGDHGVEPTSSAKSAPTGTGLLLNAKA